MDQHNLHIMDEDQSIYDWGIQNRLDQYYQDEPPGPGDVVFSDGNSQEFAAEQFPPFSPSHSHQQQQSQSLPAGAGMRSFPAPPPAHSSTLPGSAGYRAVPAFSSNRQSLTVKEEPQAGIDMSGWNVTQSEYRLYRHQQARQPPIFNLDANEALKVERKRARNRVAASKCRMRKLEKIATLDQEASKLREQNEELSRLTVKLKEEVYKLQQDLQWHINNGCQIGGRQDHTNIQNTELTDRGGAAGGSFGHQGLNTSEMASPDSTTAGSGVLSPAPIKEELAS